MHKSWGNAIDFDEAAERMGVDVMRWMFAKARPEENILFGWHAADEARRELLVLWNVYAFFVTYARLADWTPVAGGGAPGPRARCARPLDPVACGRDGGRGRGATCAPSTRSRRPASCRGSWTASPPGTCACRASGCAATTTRPTAPRRSRRSTRRCSRTAGMLAPILPFLSDVDVREPGRRCCRPSGLACISPAGRRRTWPGHRDARLERAMAVAQDAVDLARTLRSSARIRTRQPLAHAWLALPDRRHRRRAGPARDHRRRDQRQAGLGHRRRLRPGRAPRQAAPAEDRQAAGRRDPGRDGRGSRRLRRRSTRTAR